MDRYTNVLSYVTRTPWAIRAEMALVIMGILRERCAGVRLTAEEIDARLAEANTVRAAARPGPGAQAQAIAVIPVLGVIESRMEAMGHLSGGATSPQSIAQAFRAALADPAITAIVLDVDSPGGTVSGLVELADEIYKARGGKKPIVAVANSMAASAAYWIASQADEFVVTPSGEVGSIGVLTMHADMSKALEDAGVKVTFIHAGKYKVEGNPYEALGAEARTAIKADIDAYYRMFTSAVARGRRVSVETVRSEAFGEGRMVLAKEAAARGMVDRVETFDSVIARLAKPRATAGQAAGQATVERLAAEVGVAVGDPGALVLTEAALKGDRAALLREQAAAAAAESNARSQRECVAAEFGAYREVHGVDPQPEDANLRFTVGAPHYFVAGTEVERAAYVAAIRAAGYTTAADAMDASQKTLALVRPMAPAPTVDPRRDYYQTAAAIAAAEA